MISVHDNVMISLHDNVMTSLHDNVMTTQAARDACELMGHRKFYDQVIQDMLKHKEYKITDEVDVTTLKDYMQVSDTIIFLYSEQVKIK